jgi:putative ABC transport system permease protein
MLSPECLKTPPSNSTAQFDLIFAYDLYRERKPQVNAWSNGGVATYLILKENADVSQFNEKIGVFLQTKNNDPNWSLFVRPYSETYLYGKYENGIQSGGRIEYVRLFSVIAIFLLIIACINFMNLSTARASRRMKEIGIKKAIGAERKVLIGQFLSESVLMSLLSLVISIVLSALLLPQLNEITGKHLSLNFTATFILSVLSATLVTGLIAGSYPALYLSGFKPVIGLRGQFNFSTGEGWVRKVLVLFQFIVSVVLIVAALVVHKQIDFIQKKNLGYAKDNIILFRMDGKLNEGLETFLHEVKRIPGVINASAMWGNMTDVGNTTTNLQWGGKKPNDKTEFGEFDIGYDLIETLGIKLQEGRTFSRDFGSDSLKMILNEAAVRSMGLKDPLGQVIRYGDNYQVIGIVKDFHLESLYEPLKPLFMILAPYANNVVVKIKAGEEKETLERISDFYRKHNQDLSFDFKFLDQEYQTLYDAENRVAILSRYFAGIALLIACLGIFGLAAFTAQRRLNEIGIRKILGATDFSIVQMLTSDFIKTVFISLVASIPISYWIANNWLNDFAYGIDLKWWFFLGGGIVAVFIAWFTVAFQTFKAARTNPLSNLRKE